MLEKTFKAVDKAPFVGKFAIHDVVHNYVRADTLNERKRFVSAQALLGFYVVAHAEQARLGGISFQNHFENFQATSSPVDAAAMGIDAAYTLINAAVTARQANLMGRIASVKKKRSKNPEKHRPVADSSGEKDRPRNSIVVKAAAITLAGQAIFLGSLLDGKEKESHNQCIVQATEVYEQYTAQYGNENIESISDYQNRVCGSDQE